MNNRTSLGDLTYTWDANKNKTSESIAGVMSGYGFTAGGQNVVTDVKGNITSLPSTLTTQTSPLVLTWDSDNKLRSADIDANGTADVNFQYDALGRRVARTGTGGSVVYVQMDQQTIADYPVAGAASTPTYRYVYASYIDEPVVRKGAGTGGTIHYYHRNQQYSVNAVTTSTGAVAERYAYSAYGEPTICNAAGTAIASSTINNRWMYTGREWDSTVGLHHFRARWMSGLTGRFLSRDPIQYYGGGSLYTYVTSKPLVDVDPSGMSPNGATLADCRRVLYATIAGWRLLGLSCSADLMASWLSKKPDPCPSSCLSALSGDALEFVNSGCLARRMGYIANCGGASTENFQASGSHYFAPSGTIPAPGNGDDLAFSFGHVNWTATGKCVTNCSATTTNCCCSCSGSCGYELRVGPDKYDFEKGDTSYPHPLYCAWYVQEHGGLKSFSADCRKTVYAQSISFKRCPGPPAPWSIPCSQTKQTGNTNVIE